MEKEFYVYIMSNKYRTVFYVGMTSNLQRRAWEHKSSVRAGFTSFNRCKYLLWYEEHVDFYSAERKEKQMKRWRREYKMNVISEMNPGWDDLAAAWY